VRTENIDKTRTFQGLWSPESGWRLPQGIKASKEPYLVSFGSRGTFLARVALRVRDGECDCWALSPSLNPPKTFSKTNSL
jgi:hypothetical protein